MATGVDGSDWSVAYRVPLEDLWLWATGEKDVLTVRVEEALRGAFEQESLDELSRILFCSDLVDWVLTPGRSAHMPSLRNMVRAWKLYQLRGSNSPR